MFPKHAGVKDSNKAEVFGHFESSSDFLLSYQERLFEKSDSYNAVAWVSHNDSMSWKFQLYFNEISFACGLLT